MNPERKAINADSSTSGKQENTALTMFLAAAPGLLLAATKANPGDSTRLT